MHACVDNVQFLLTIIKVPSKKFITGVVMQTINRAEAFLHSKCLKVSCIVIVLLCSFLNLDFYDWFRSLYKKKVAQQCVIVL